ncbi:hypothetical protein A0H81_03498 [Grifola frondosa]|uniref:Cytochrome P450 n=1 Tax=Grifola frondosa TaxID=5627 RepID=A0A1C7MHX3_GRIFR|nr:hypothetical protein A0H81_03498 [Grifola frondosa]
MHIRSIPPGIPFLSRYLLHVVVPPIVVLLSARYASLYGGVSLPTWFWAVAVLASDPFVLTVRILFKFWNQRHQAALFGAIVPPRLNGKWPGNFDVFRDVIRLTRFGYPSDMFDLGFDGNGPIFQYNIFWDTAYTTCDPEIVKTVLSTDFVNYEKGSIVTICELWSSYVRSLFGTGVFNSDGEMWKFHRSMARPFFSRERISHFELFDRHAEHALLKMKERLQAGIAVNFQDLIARFTLDSATEFLFGFCVQSLSSPLPYPHNVAAHQTTDEPISAAEKFAQAFASAQAIVSERPRVGWTWPLQEFFRDKTDEHMVVVDSVLQPILEDALRKKEARMRQEEETTDEKADDNDDTLLDHLARLTSDLSILHDETLNVLLAGRDTTASTLTFTIYLLCMYPDVLKCLREEVLLHVGPIRRPTYDSIRGMKYLRAVLNETLRLYPPVCSIKESTLPNPDPHGKPIYIPAKTGIAYSVMNMHRNPKYWGPDAEKYDPDRFIDERVNKYLVPTRSSFSRSMLGHAYASDNRRFAYNEMSFFIIRLLQNFSTMSLDLSAQPPDSSPPAEWKNAKGRKALEQIFPKVHIGLYSFGGLWVKMGEAEGQEPTTS